MLLNEQYNTRSLLGFQMSMLYLGAALDEAAPSASEAAAVAALARVERLKNLIESSANAA